MTPRTVLACCAVAIATAGCTVNVDGLAVRGTGRADAGVDVARALLSPEQMQAITGGGEDLTIIPSMDSPSPVDVEALADSVPPPCRFLFAETATFGPEIETFHKTTYQYPPRSAIISQGAASYRDAAAARIAFEALTETVRRCAADDYGALLVGELSSEAAATRMRPGDCGRDYRLKATMLIEVTFCGFPESVSQIVMSNILNRVPAR